MGRGADEMLTVGSLFSGIGGFDLGLERAGLRVAWQCEKDDAGVVLGVLADLGYGWCYRVLDAQWFGVAQRRRRVFIVGCLGDPRRAGEVLLESSCCDGDSAPSREAGQEIAGSLEACPPGHRQRADASDNLVMAGALAFHQTQEPITGEDWTPALGATSIGMGVAYPLAMRGRDDGAELEMGDPDLYNALRAGDGGSSRQNLVMASTAVRRLMPVECERLQGFPDDWTADETDSARYRMLGNAICVPVAQWIGQRLAEVA